MRFGPESLTGARNYIQPMSTTTNIIGDPLPQEMQPHTYPIMYRVEGSHWWFVGRRRILSSFVRRIIESLNTPQPRILDVGCGTGANLEMLAEFGEAEGVDVSREALDFCQTRGLQNVRQGEAEHLPYEDNSFDLVTGLDVVEHLDNDVGGLQEMRRVLRPGGKSAPLRAGVHVFMGSPGRHQQSSPTLHARQPQAGCATGRAWKLELATYANITFFAPILLGRLLMRVTGFRPASENNLTVVS